MVPPDVQQHFEGSEFAHGLWCIRELNDAFIAVCTCGDWESRPMRSRAIARTAFELHAGEERRSA